MTMMFLQPISPIALTVMPINALNVKPVQALLFTAGLKSSYLSLADGGSELVLKNLDKVSSMELKACTVEMWDEEARILAICGWTLG